MDLKVQVTTPRVHIIPKSIKTVRNLSLCEAYKSQHLPFLPCLLWLATCHSILFLNNADWYTYFIWKTEYLTMRKNTCAGLRLFITKITHFHHNFMLCASQLILRLYYYIRFLYISYPTLAWNTLTLLVLFMNLSRNQWILSNSCI